MAVRALFIGLASGLIGGLFGVGGGIVLVPGLVLLLALEQHEAHATSLAVIVPTAAAALIPFAADGAIRWDSAGWLLIGGLAGAYAAARLMRRIPPQWLARAFVVLVAVAAVRMAVP